MLKVAADFVAQFSLFKSGMLPNLPVPSSEVTWFYGLLLAGRCLQLWCTTLLILLVKHNHSAVLI